MSSRNSVSQNSMSIKKYVIRALKQKSNKNIGKNKLNIPDYIVDEMRKSYRNTMQKKLSIGNLFRFINFIGQQNTQSSQFHSRNNIPGISFIK